jgi:hypothetical protein
MSRISSAGPTSLTARTLAAADGRNALPTTTSTGSGIAARWPCRDSLPARFGNEIGLAQRLADRMTGRREEGVGDAAADDQLVDLASSSDFEHRELGRHLGAGDDRHHRPRRLLQRALQRLELAISSGPAQATGANRPRHACWPRRGAPCRRHPSRRRRRASPSPRQRFGSSFFSPLLKRTFSHSTTSPGAISTPPSQSLTSGTGLPSSSESRVATGASETAPDRTCLPPGGRGATAGSPRALVQRMRMVGSAARMRASLVTLPSFTGTLRSSRISTRLPARSDPPSAAAWSSRVPPVQRALTSASVVSSMRLEKPHSLSYQAHTLTSVPPMTLVRVAHRRPRSCAHRG